MLSNTSHCFIFDLDGTLVFNKRANFLAYEATFAQLGMRIAPEEYNLYFGLGIEEMLQKHTEKLGIPYTPELLKQVKTLKEKEYTDRLHLIEPNRALIAVATSLGSHCPIALTTTAREVNARAVLYAFGLSDLFPFTVFGEDLQRRKPDPQCYQLVADHYHMKPKDCVVFEDSEIGFEAVKRFGGLLCRIDGEVRSL